MKVNSTSDKDFATFKDGYSDFLTTGRSLVDTVTTSAFSETFISRTIATAIIFLEIRVPIILKFNTWICARLKRAHVVVSVRNEELMKVFAANVKRNREVAIDKTDNEIGTIQIIIFYKT